MGVGGSRGRVGARLALSILLLAGMAGFAKKYNLPLRLNRAPSGPLADTVDLAYRLPRTFIVAPGGALVASRQGSQKWDDPQVDEKILSRLRNAAALVR